MSPFASIILTLVILIVLNGGVFFALYRIIQSRKQAIRERFPTADLYIPNVNFFGQQSRGVMQLRGNGTFVLTRDEIFFERWLPRAEFVVPLAHIKSVETVNSFLGKIVFRSLLKVVYQNQSGQLDAIAWLVPDLEDLKKMIEDRIA